MDKNKFAVIRLIKDSEICKWAEDCLDEKDDTKVFYYNSLTEEFQKELEDTYKVLILFYDAKNNADNDDNSSIYKIVFCNCEINSQKSLECRAIYSSESEVVIINVLDCLFLDLKNDFNEDYIMFERSKKLAEQLIELTRVNQKFSKPNLEYKSLEDEESLHPLAQKNNYCIRQYNLKNPTSDRRSEFQRDYDRIVYSKSFRRMVDKTQVFSSSKGDHYRTRMTHSMIVCQIARSICHALNLNQALTEAIAIGHDLGHTPFGHVGERTLNKILNDRFKDVGGFKHNYQGLRVVSKLEKQYFEIDGLDLSYQVMEGMFKHTKQKEGVVVSEFINDPEFIEYLNVEIEHSVTLEGQIVCIADEIAQRSHDIDDAFASKLLTFDEFLSYLELNKFEKLKEEIEAIQKRKNTAEENHTVFSNENDLFSFQISSAIIKFFIADVIDSSKEALNEYYKNNADNFDYNHIITKQLINFSKKGKLICLYLEKLLNSKVLNSTEVSLSDNNSEEIIKTLFNSYFKNPQLLHNGTKRAIYNDFVNNRSANGDIKDVINLANGSQDAIKREFKKIINPENDEYKAKQKILVRDICDYIAGMTDSYALEQYRKICKFLSIQK